MKVLVIGFAVGIAIGFASDLLSDPGTNKPLTKEVDPRKEFTTLANWPEAQAKCQRLMQASAKYPNEVQFPMLDQTVTKPVWYTDGNNKERGYIEVRPYAKAMNGFGMMIPLQGYCKFVANMETKTLELNDFQLQ